MGTAVLHPQDCLPPSQSQPNRRFVFASEYGSISAAMESCVRHSSFEIAENRGILGHRDSSAGLLPLPDRVPQICYSSAYRSAVKFSPSSYKRCRSPASTYGSAIPMRRCSLPSHDGHGRRQPACNDLGNAAPARLSKAAGTGGLSAHLPIAPKAKTHIPRFYNDALLKWPEVELLSEASQPASHLGRGGTKRFFNDVADVQMQQSCKSSEALTRRQGRSRHSMSGKTQEKGGSNLALSCTQQVARKLATSLSNMSALAHCRNGRGYGIPGCPAFVMEKDTPLQGSLSPRRLEKNVKAGTEISSPSPWSHHVNDTERARGIVHQILPHHRMELKDGAPEGHVNSLPQVLGSRLTLCSTINSNCYFSAEDVLGCFDSAYDTNSWLSMVDERWAGPSFFNSPPPSSLPLPSFTFKLPRTTSSSPEAINDEASFLSEAAFAEAKPMQDIAFATKDLRRLLHLDHACCDT